MKHLRVCFVLLPVLILGAFLAPSAGAVSGEVPEGLSFREAKGFRTLVTDTEGETHWQNGVPDVPALGAPGSCPELASYAVYCGEEVILEAELHRLPSAGEGAELQSVIPAGGGYYAAQFDVSVDQLAFITGLTTSNLEAVQQELIRSRQNGTQFDMTHVDFIDAEKMDYGPGEYWDSNLCWAAAASNVLHYTGWGEQAHESLTSPDAIFQTFIYSFTDDGLTSEDGIRWFFSGVNRQQWDESGAQALGNYGEFRGFLPDYAPDSVMRKYDIVDRLNGTSWPLDMDIVLSHLREGWGCTVGLGWYEQRYGNYYQRDGGHAVTLWGYIREKSIQEINADGYIALLVSDSDSDNAGNYTVEDAWNAENRLQIMNLSYVWFNDVTDPYDTETYGKRYDTWYIYNRDGIGLLESFTVLQPYSSTIPKEESRQTYVNRFQFDTLDISAYLDIYDRSSGGGWSTETFLTDDEGTATVNFFYGWKNFLYYWTKMHPLQADITIRDSRGKTVYSNSGQDTVFLGEQEWGWNDSIELPDGEYTATLTVKVLDGSREAYYTNNTCTRTFTVVNPGKRMLQAELSGVSESFLLFDVYCKEPAEYGSLYVRFPQGDNWGEWTRINHWFERSEEYDDPRVGYAEPAKVADSAVFGVWIHRGGQNYFLTSDPVRLRFTATLDPMGGQVSPASVTIYPGMTSGPLPTPVREGHTFLGWFQKDGTEITGETVGDACADQTLYAHWDSPWSLSAQLSGTALSYDIGVPAGETAGLFAAAYDEKGRMIDIQRIPDVTAGTGTLTVPEAARYKVFLLRGGAPMCPAWCWPEE